MKNVLIIRSANMETMEKLIDYLTIHKKGYNIYCMIQKNSIESFKVKFPYVNFIEKKDGFFKYKDFKKDFNLKKILKDIKFHYVYIPSSTTEFLNFEDVFMIASRIKCDTYMLFNMNGDIQEYDFKFFSLWIDKYLGEVIYFIKVLVALIGIFIIYAFAYPYYFIKRKLFKNI